MASETTAANPELIQTQVASLLVQPLEAASVVLASGVRIFDTNGPLRIPKPVSGAAVEFVDATGRSDQSIEDTCRRLSPGRRLAPSSKRSCPP